MIKSVTDRESRQFSQSWDIQNTSSIPPIRDKKRSISSLNDLGETAANKGCNAKTKMKEAHQVQRFIKGG